MNSYDVNYISAGFMALYKKFGFKNNLHYVPLDTVNTTTDKTGRLNLVYLESEAIDMYGLLVDDNYNDIDTTSKGDGRINATVQFVIKPLLDVGITPKVKDALDVMNVSGIYDRYVVTGFSNKVELNGIFISVFVTDKAHAFVNN